MPRPRAPVNSRRSRSEEHRRRRLLGRGRRDARRLDLRPSARALGGRHRALPEHADRLLAPAGRGRDLDEGDRPSERRGLSPREARLDGLCLRAGAGALYGQRRNHARVHAQEVVRHRLFLGQPDKPQPHHPRRLQRHVDRDARRRSDLVRRREPALSRPAERFRPQAHRLAGMGQVPRHRPERRPGHAFPAPGQEHRRRQDLRLVVETSTTRKSALSPTTAPITGASSSG